MCLRASSGQTLRDPSAICLFANLLGFVFRWDQIEQVLLEAPAGRSLIQPLDMAGQQSSDLAYFLIAVIVAGIVAASGYDLITSLTTAATTLGNVGPGLGEIGPTDNFAHFPGHVKLVLSAAMIAGRLEIFTILIVFHPVFWRS